MAFTLALVLDRAFKDAGIPVVGLSFTDLNDRTTWRAQYAASATADQRTQGDAILATLQPDDPTTLANLKADYALSQADIEVIKDIVLALYECIPAPTKTPAQLRARILALLKA